MNVQQLIQRSLKKNTAIYCFLLVASCSNTDKFSYYVNGPNFSDLVGAGCKFDVLNTSNTIKISSNGYCNLAEFAGVHLTIPGDKVGNYDNSASFSNYAARYYRQASVPNAFSASILTIDSHFISGTFHGTIYNAAQAPPAPYYELTGGEIQLNY